MLKKLLLAVSVLCLILFLAYSVKKSTVITYGFASYYTSSRILLEGDPPAMSYDTTYFNMKIRQFGIANIHDITTGAPTNYLLFLPVSWLSPVAAKIVWTAVSVMSLFFAIYILFLVFDIPNYSITGLLILITAFLFYPVYYNITLGQTYIFLLLLFSLSLYGLKEYSPWLTAVPLGIIIAVKGYGLIPLLVLPLCKKWKETALTAAVVIAIILLTLPLVHIQMWSEYYSRIFTSLGRDEYSSGVAYQTVNGFLRHMFFSESAVVPAAFTFADISVAVVSFVILGIIAFRRKLENPVSLFTAAIALNVVLAPLAEEYHYVLILPLIFLLGSSIISKAGENKIVLVMFLIALIVLALPLNYKALQGASFPLILLAYPKLFSAIVLLLIYRFTGLNGGEVFKEQAA